MISISDDKTFKAVLRKLDGPGQRVVAAKFVENVLPLCNDIRIAHVVSVAGNRSSSHMDLAEAFKIARSSVLHNRARSGSAGDWQQQASYFVARAAVAALSPKCHMPEGVAWHAALNSRLACTSKAIDNGTHTDMQERINQYHILTGLLTP